MTQDEAAGMAVSEVVYLWLNNVLSSQLICRMEINLNIKLWSPDFFQTIKDRMVQSEALTRAYRNLEARVAAFIAKPIDIPLRGGGWSHNYNCPDDGSYLKCVDRSHHQCPICQKIYSGTPWDDTAIADEHWAYSWICRDAAVLYGINGERKWADWAKRVLLFYSEHYQDYPFHDKLGGKENSGGKVQCQTLSESTWIVPLAQACHILCEHNILAPDQMDFIKTNLLWPVVAVIQGNPRGKSNWQSHHNAAKATIAAVVNDRNLFDEALNDEVNGFRFQMDHSLGDDGFWYEGSWGYHFYALEAQVTTVLAATCFGLRLFENRRLRAMFSAPVNCQFSNHTLPPVHDSHEVNLTQYEYLYEFANAFWGYDGGLLSGSRRDSLYSLLFGTVSAGLETDKQAHSFAAVTDLLKAGMIFVKLEDGASGLRHDLMLDYGEHGGGHGHYDKLNLLYQAQGYNWLTDAGTVPYGNPLYTAWFRQTIAHNTVVISGKSQQETTGRLVEVKKADGLIHIKAETRGAYPDLIMERDLTLTAKVLIDVCHVSGKEPRDIDWVIHTPGTPVPAEDSRHSVPLQFGPVEPLKLGDSDGYQFLENFRKARAHGWQWGAEWKRADGADPRRRFQVYGLEIGAFSEIYRGESPAMPEVKKRSVFIRRQKMVQEAFFVTVFRVCDQDEPRLELTPAETGCDGKQIRVILSGVVHYIINLTDDTA